MTGPALSLRFDVVIDGVAIGAGFSGCSGLGASVETTDWKEGGDNGTVQRLPLRVSYTPVTLTRAVDRDSGALAAWFSAQSVSPSRHTVVITLFDAGFGAGNPVASWTLSDAWPSQYSGPTLSTASGSEGVAVETLQLTHNGYTS